MVARSMTLAAIVMTGLLLGVVMYQGWRALPRGSRPSAARQPVGTVVMTDGTSDVTATLGVRDVTSSPGTDDTRVATVFDSPILVGVIPGHWMYDTGAVCADGRREVDVTKDVAMRIRAILEHRGYAVDLLPEHDPRAPGPPLQNYRAAAVVSVHADSCDYRGVSGYKVARWAYSEMPEVEDRLVSCLNDEYAAATLLDRHEDTITADMWDYYAFRELAVDTPAAIIELGFLGGDREALDRLRYEMALGIANGITCFLNEPQ